ncbi:hypothetical protein JL720_13478 [Aureococcus anophagefferens]|nr:hypothetical protein JL720_13478 [Aureococcus anophagefferens]
MIARPKAPTTATIATLVEDDGLVAASRTFEAALGASDFKDFCENKVRAAASDGDKRVWTFMQLIFEPNAREKLLECLGYDAAAVAATLPPPPPPDAPAAPPPRSPSSASCGPSSRTSSALVAASDLRKWEETLAILSTYGKSDEFPALCEALGGRLEHEARDDKAAALCYMCAVNVPKTVKFWIDDFNAASRSLGKVDTLALQDLVEKGEALVAAKYCASRDDDSSLLLDRLHRSAGPAYDGHPPAFAVAAVQPSSVITGVAPPQPQSAFAAQQQPGFAAQPQQGFAAQQPAQQPFAQPAAAAPAANGAALPHPLDGDPGSPQPAPVPMPNVPAPRAPQPAAVPQPAQFAQPQQPAQFAQRQPAPQPAAAPAPPPAPAPAPKPQPVAQSPEAVALVNSHWGEHKDWLKGLKFLIQLAQKKM